MRIYKNPTSKELSELLKRGTEDKSSFVEDRVREMLSMVKSGGEKVLMELVYSIDRVDLSASGLRVSESEIEDAIKMVDPELKGAMAKAKQNIAAFHEIQKCGELKTTTQAGVVCWQRGVPITTVGLYAPGGTAPLFSTVLMLAVPAKIAGCKEVILCSPPDENGSIAPEILYAAHICGVDKIFKLGGAMAIAAMAYGTENIPKVEKIFGPGNAYVTTAKQMVSLSDVAIDMPAGPSEVMVVADATANPEFIAADLLSQAEHGPDSQAILVTTSMPLAERVSDEVEKQVESLSREKIARKSLRNSRIIVVDRIGEMVDIVNRYAPEHLIIEMDEPSVVVEGVVNAGSVFIGHFTPESAGDYASGTNHTLPTNGWAVSYSGVNLCSFGKKITFQQISEEGLRGLEPTIKLMADAEGLTGHARAATIRVKE